MSDNPITIGQMRVCAERELKLRKSAYPKWVSKGALSQDTADREIRMMAAIVEHFNKLEQPELPI